MKGIDKNAEWSAVGSHNLYVLLNNMPVTYAAESSTGMLAVIELVV